MNNKLYVTYHCLERFQEHHPDNDWDDIRIYIRYGLTVNPEDMRKLLNREYTKESDSYILAPDRKGCFIVHTTLDGRRTAVTYLRFSKCRVGLAWSTWPEG